MFANIKNILWVLFFSFWSQPAFANTDDIVDGFAEFLVERANANLVYVIERRLKNDKNFQCYFPNTYKKVNDLKLGNLFSSKNYWENSLNDDLRELAFRAVLPQIQSMNDVIKDINKTDINKIIEKMQYLEYKYNGKRYPITYIGLDWPDEVKKQVNGFNRIILDLKKLKTINIDKTILDKLINKKACQLETGYASQLDEYLIVAKTFSKWTGFIAKYGKNLRLSKKGVNNLVCKPKNMTDQQCSKLKSGKRILMGVLLKDQYISKIFKVRDAIDKLGKLYAAYYKLDAKQKLSLTAVSLSLPLLKLKLYPGKNIKEIKKILKGINLTDLNSKQKIVTVMFKIKNNANDDVDRVRVLSKLQEFLDSEKSHAERSLIGLGLLKQRLDLSSSSYDRLHRSVMFFSTIADATSKEAVKSILEAYTLPPVSFAEKRKQGSGVFITSYLGYAATSYDVDSSSERASNGGLFAPVGLEYNYGLDNGGSWSIMLSPIDMAYPINLKLNGIKDKVELDEIIAPSLTVAYGFDDYPLNIGFGYQRGRTLVDIGKAEDTFLLFISFDMPLFRLY